MEMTTKAAETARRNLVQRMERFLVTSESDRTPIGPWETNLLCRVLAHLQTGQFRAGEDAMLQVESPDLYRSPKALASVANSPTLTVAQVRANLAEVLAEQERYR